MSRRGEVLVAILNNRLDFNLARDHLWYRIPVSSVRKWLKSCWPPQWLAFYQTKVFGGEAYAVHYYGRVVEIHQVYRWQLFPDEPRDEKGMHRYYQIFLESLVQLPQPIRSRRRRRIVFIPTTLEKFVRAAEINDLYDDSPLEDLLWQQLKRLGIWAERQEFIEIGDSSYALDFVVYCQLGKLDIETDGDTWHSNPEKASEDNLRDNALEGAGWSLLRFNTPQLREQMPDYCVPTIVNKVNGLGGLNEGGGTPRRIDLDPPGGMHQLGLFDGL